MTAWTPTAPRATERRSSAAERHAHGSYYTPPPLVDRVVRLALEPLLDAKSVIASWRDLRRALDVQILDPAAGDGAFLTNAAEFLVEALATRMRVADLGRLRAAVLRRCLYGIDVHAEAIDAARVRLDMLAERPSANVRQVARHLRCADSLLVDLPSLWPRIAQRGGFDAVIGNPPFVDAETMTRTAPELRAQYGRRWSTARGNWDLCVPFVELCLSLARPAGQVALVLPNKLLSATYAARIRRRIAAERLRSVVDLSASASFAAADVYPMILHVERAPAASSGTIRVQTAAGDVRDVPIATFSSIPDHAWNVLLSEEWTECARALARAVPLGTVARIAGAATVAEAYEMAELITDWPVDTALPANRYPVVNTGTIGRYRHAWGERPLRYLRRRYGRPVIAAAILRAKWPRRAAQAAAPKLIVAGLAREPRAVWDRSGELLAAKSTIVITSTQVDLPLLAAILNSHWMARVYRALFGGLALQGGYLQFTTAHLKALPFPAPGSWSAQRPLEHEIQTLVDAIYRTNDPAEFQRLDEAIEAHVENLFHDDQA